MLLRVGLSGFLIFLPALISHFIPKRYAESPVSRCMTLQNGDTEAAQHGALVVDYKMGTLRRRSMERW